MPTPRALVMLYHFVGISEPQNPTDIIKAHIGGFGRMDVAPCFLWLMSLIQ